MKIRVPSRTAALAVFAMGLLPALATAQQSPPQLRYDADPDVLKLPPDLYLGEVSGVAVDSKRNIYVFSRGSTTGPAYGATAAQLLEFDPTGTFLREIGHNLYAWSFAHTVRIDPQDNIWAVDKGSDMVIRFNQAGRVTMVFGRKQEASDDGAEPWTRVSPPRPHVDGQFRQPTDVTWDPQGDVFISDGYINSRVAKYDRNGDWVKSWGERGTADGEFNTPHSIAADARGNVYVADRGNRRIQVFDPDGKHLRTITIDVPIPANAKPWYGNVPTTEAAAAQNGAPWAICITPGPGTQYLFSADAFPGRIYKLTLDGRVVGVLGSSGRQPGQFGWVHEIACPSEHELYVAEILNWRLQKLTLRPATEALR